MSYFDQILDGNIPLSVIESIEGFQGDLRMGNSYPQYKLNPHKKNHHGIQGVLQSHYGAHVRASMNLKRDDIVRGIKQLLTSTTNDALTRNRNEIARLAVDNIDRSTFNKIV